MSKRENILVIDVETCGDLEKPLVYDLGVAVVERSTGRVIESHSLIIDEVFYGMSDLMQSAYYACKLPQYHEGIKSGAWRVVKMWTAWRLMRDLIAQYGVKRVYAYNANFDSTALNNTFATLTAGKGRKFVKGVEWCCIWHMACQTLCKQVRYRKFVAAHGFVSPAGNIRTSAEVVYAFMVGEPTFEEQHTGLDDVLIETSILHKVLRQKRRVSERINRMCWTIPQGLHAGQGRLC